MGELFFFALFFLSRSKRPTAAPEEPPCRPPYQMERTMAEDAIDGRQGEDATAHRLLVQQAQEADEALISSKIAW